MFYPLKLKYINIFLRKLINILVVIFFFTAQIVSFCATDVLAQTLLNLPPAGVMLNTSPSYAPAMIKGLTIFPKDPFVFDFIIHPGEKGFQGEELASESKKLIKYFMAALTTPENEMWVNLSPEEPDRIITAGFGQTEMGRDLLAQDYLLKQMTSSLLSPGSELGEKFWEQVYETAYQEYGNVDIPVDILNKVWIVPQTAEIYENGNNVFVTKCKLKVLLDKEYLSYTQKQTNELAANDIVREIIIPALEKEVNFGKHFAPLRQIANSVILASWYKKNVQGSILDQLYIDQHKTQGIATEDKEITQKIYNQYLELFKQGVNEFIKEDYDPVKQEVIERKYFTGGAKLDFAMIAKNTADQVDFAMLQSELSQSSKVSMRLSNKTIDTVIFDPAMLMEKMSIVVDEKMLQNFEKYIGASLQEKGEAVDEFGAILEPFKERVVEYFENYFPEFALSYNIDGRMSFVPLALSYGLEDAIDSYRILLKDNPDYREPLKLDFQISLGEKNEIVLRMISNGVGEKVFNEKKDIPEYKALRIGGRGTGRSNANYFAETPHKAKFQSFDRWEELRDENGYIDEIILSEELFFQNAIGDHSDDLLKLQRRFDELRNLSNEVLHKKYYSNAYNPYDSAMLQKRAPDFGNLINQDNLQKYTELIGLHSSVPTFTSIIDSLGEFTQGLDVKYTLKNDSGNQFGSVPFVLSQEGMDVFFNALQTRGVDYRNISKDAHLVFFKPDQNNFEGDYSDYNQFPVGIVFNNPKYNRKVYFDISAIFNIIPSQDFLFEGAMDMFPLGYGEKWEGFQLFFQDSEIIKYIDNNQVHFKNFRILQINKILLGRTSPMSVEKDLYTIFSSVHNQATDYYRALVARRRSLKDKTVHVTGPGTGIDVLYALHFGAKSVSYHDISPASQTLTKWNIVSAVQQGDINDNPPISSADDFMDAQVYLFNMPSVQSEYSMVKLELDEEEQGNRNPQHILRSYQISRNNFLSVFERLKLKLKSNPGSSAIWRLWATNEAYVFDKFGEFEDPVRNFLKSHGLLGREIVLNSIAEQGHMIKGIYHFQSDKAMVGERKEFEIPSDWDVSPDKIVYDKNTDPTREKIQTKHAVSVVMLDENGDVLFARRNPKLGGVWSLPSSFIEGEDDPNLLKYLNKKVEKNLGTRIEEVELMGKRMGYRKEKDGSVWQLLMHVVFAKAYTGKPYQTGAMHDTGMPKYTEMGFFNPEQFLTGKIGSFDLDTAGDCTKCYGTILHRGSFEEYVEAFKSNKESGADNAMVSRSELLKEIVLDELKEKLKGQLFYDSSKKGLEKNQSTFSINDPDKYFDQEDIIAFNKDISIPFIVSRDGDSIVVERIDWMRIRPQLETYMKDVAPVSDDIISVIDSIDLNKVFLNNQKTTTKKKLESIRTKLGTFLENNAEFSLKKINYWQDILLKEFNIISGNIDHITNNVFQPIYDSLAISEIAINRDNEDLLRNHLAKIKDNLTRWTATLIYVKDEHERLYLDEEYGIFGIDPADVKLVTSLPEQPLWMSEWENAVNESLLENKSLSDIVMQVGSQVFPKGESFKERARRWFFVDEETGEAKAYFFKDQQWYKVFYKKEDGQLRQKGKVEISDNDERERFERVLLAWGSFRHGTKIVKGDSIESVMNQLSVILALSRKKMQQTKKHLYDYMTSVKNDYVDLNDKLYRQSNSILRDIIQRTRAVNVKDIDYLEDQLKYFSFKTQEFGDTFLELSARSGSEYKASFDKLQMFHEDSQLFLDSMLNLVSVDSKEYSSNLSETMSLLKNGFKAKSESIVWENNFENMNVDVPGSQGSIALIMENLINNGIKWSENMPDPKVRVSIEQDEQDVYIVIKDKGPGTGNENVWRKALLGATGEEGLGLGLPLVRMLMKDIGGEMIINSLPGSGTSITLQIPIVKSKNNDAAMLDIENEAKESLTTSSMLSIEDQDVVKTIEDLFKDKVNRSGVVKSSHFKQINKNVMTDAFFGNQISASLREIASIVIENISLPEPVYNDVSKFEHSKIGGATIYSQSDVHLYWNTSENGDLSLKKIGLDAGPGGGLFNTAKAITNQNIPFNLVSFGGTGSISSALHNILANEYLQFTQGGFNSQESRVNIRNHVDGKQEVLIPGLGKTIEHEDVKRYLTQLDSMLSSSPEMKWLLTVVGGRVQIDRAAKDVHKMTIDLAHNHGVDVFIDIRDLVTTDEINSILDLSIRPSNPRDIVASNEGEFLDLLEESSLFKGVSGMKGLLGIDEIKDYALHFVRRFNLKGVFVTLGTRGMMFVLNDGRSFFEPIIKVDVDSIRGAGDASNAGFALALSEGKSWQAAIYQAKIFATATIQTPAGIFPNKEDIRSLMEKDAAMVGTRTTPISDEELAQLDSIRQPEKLHSEVNALFKFFGYKAVIDPDSSDQNIIEIQKLNGDFAGILTLLNTDSFESNNEVIVSNIRIKSDFRKMRLSSLLYRWFSSHPDYIAKYQGAKLIVYDTTKSSMIAWLRSGFEKPVVKPTHVISNKTEKFNLEAYFPDWDARQGKDSAMVGEAKDLGGIDLNPDLISVTTSGEGVKIQFPPIDLNVTTGDINGFVPIIINITPLTNIPQLLGLKEEDEVVEGQDLVASL